MLTLLLVEDEAINRLAAKRFLERLGHTVLCAGHGREALEMLCREHIDCVFMDVSMPEMDGLEATRAIRLCSDGSKPADVPIIAMTAHAMEGDRKAFLEAGMDGYVPKPVELTDLEAELNRVLQARRRPE